MCTQLEILFIILSDRLEKVWNTQMMIHMEICPSDKSKYLIMVEAYLRFSMLTLPTLSLANSSV